MAKKEKLISTEYYKNWTIEIRTCFEPEHPYVAIGRKDQFVERIPGFSENQARGLMKDRIDFSEAMTQNED